MNALEAQKLVEDLKQAFEKHHLLNDCDIELVGHGDIIVTRNFWSKTAINHLITITDVADCNFIMHKDAFVLYR